ncbi:MAG: hypothetical protein L0Z52_11420 [Acidobacteria bacterium]|nr:hypothetical protein [Acidobacteriota bacterium]
MPDIHVIFQDSGKPTLRHEAEIFPRGEAITWCFHSANPKIKSVEVEFSHPASRFFEGTTSPLSRRVALVNGQADFYGRVPNYPVPLPSPMFAKYTVKGWSDVAGGQVVEFLDPVIITSQP